MDQSDSRSSESSEEVTPAMLEAGAEAIYESEWEFKADAKMVARRVFEAMLSAKN